MKKLLPVIAVLCLVTVVIWQLFFTEANYYLVSAVILILSMLPFLSSFERENSSAGELALMAGLIALAVVSRAFFYLTPQVKPIAAVVGISGAALGAKRGYLIGAFSMFISNFIFGQGAWTPFQMVAMGLVGLAFGLIFEKVKPTKISLAVAGFAAVVILYGGIVDLCSVLFFNPTLEPRGIAAVYAAGAPFNLIFGAVTAVCMLLFGDALTSKISRIKIKYGLEREN